MLCVLLLLPVCLYFINLYSLVFMFCLRKRLSQFVMRESIGSPYAPPGRKACARYRPSGLWVCLPT